MRRGLLATPSIVRVALFLALAIPACSDQPDLDGPPPDAKSLWLVRADGTGDFTDLQTALSNSGTGDTVLVGPGTWSSRAQHNINGVPVLYAAAARGLGPRKVITLLSEAGVDSTVIGDDTLVDYDLVFDNVNGTVRGFEIRGAGNRGVYVYNSDVSIEGCRVVGTSRGVFSDRSTLRLRDTHILGTTTAEGLSAEDTRLTTSSNRIEGCATVGIACSRGTTATLTGDSLLANRIAGLIITESTAVADRILIARTGVGGTVTAVGAGVTGSDVTLRRATIADTRGHALQVSGTSSDVVVENSLLAASTGCALLHSGGRVSFACCGVWGNSGSTAANCVVPQGETVSYENPLFCDAAAGDYGLRSSSPFAAENSGACGAIGAFAASCAP